MILSRANDQDHISILLFWEGFSTHHSRMKVELHHHPAADAATAAL